MAMSKDEIKAIVDKSTAIEKINITDFFIMLLEKTKIWKERLV